MYHNKNEVLQQIKLMIIHRTVLNLICSLIRTIPYATHE